MTDKEKLKMHLRNSAVAKGWGRACHVNRWLALCDMALVNRLLAQRVFANYCRRIEYLGSGWLPLEARASENVTASYYVALEIEMARRWATELQ